MPGDVGAPRAECGPVSVLPSPLHPGVIRRRQVVPLVYGLVSSRTRLRSSEYTCRWRLRPAYALQCKGPKESKASKSTAWPPAAEEAVHQ